jgi:hypothetical protein
MLRRFSTPNAQRPTPNASMKKAPLLVTRRSVDSRQRTEEVSRITIHDSRLLHHSITPCPFCPFSLARSLMVDSGYDASPSTIHASSLLVTRHSKVSGPWSQVRGDHRYNFRQLSAKIGAAEISLASNFRPCPPRCRFFKRFATSLAAAVE